MRIRHLLLSLFVFALVLFSASRAYAFLTSVDQCASDPQCAAELGFGPRSALVEAGTPALMGQGGGAVVTDAAGAVVQTVEGVSGIQGSGISAVTFSRVASAVGTAGNVLATINTTSISPGAVEGIRMDAYKAACAADATLCVYWLTYYPIPFNDKRTAIVGVADPAMLDPANQYGHDGYWGDCYRIIIPGDWAYTNSWQPFKFEPFDSNFKWDQLSDAERNNVINWALANRPDLVSGAISVTTSTVTIPPGGHISVSTPMQNILQVSPNGSSSVAGGQYISPLSVPGVSTTVGETGTGTGTNTGTGTGTGTGSGSTTGTTTGTGTGTGTNTGSNTNTNTGSSSSTTTGSSTTNSTTTATNTNTSIISNTGNQGGVSDGQNPDPNKSGTDPSQQQQQETVTPPSTATDPIELPRPEVQNFVSYAVTKFSSKFPFDVVGQMPSGAASSACPKFTFFGRDFELCFIRDALSILRIPVVISFVIWSVMSI